MILAIIVRNYRYEEVTKGKAKAKEAAAGASKGKGGTSKGKAKASTSSAAAAGDSDFYIPPQNKWPVKIVRFYTNHTDHEVFSHLFLEVCEFVT